MGRANTIPKVVGLKSADLSDIYFLSPVMQYDPIVKTRRFIPIIYIAT